MSRHTSIIHSHEARLIIIRISAPCQRRSWIAFISPAKMATVRAVLKHPKSDMKYTRLWRHCVVIILIPACSQTNSFPLSYKHSESEAKYMEELENSGWKGPQEVSRPTAFPKQTQLQPCQTMLLRAPSTLVLKAPMDGGCINSWGKVFDCSTVLM